MADRVPSDHASVETHRVSLDTVGRTSRLRVTLPETLAVAEGDVLRLTIDDSDAHAQVRTGLDGHPEVRGAFDNARLARADEGENRLAEWLDAVGLDAGQSVLLDELVAGSHYGLREPGERTVYTVREPPSDSLADIASQLDE